MVENAVPNETEETGVPAVPDEVESAVKKVAEKKPEKLFEMMAMGLSTVGNPLHQKMTPEHISQVLDLAARHDEREFELNKKSQEHEFAHGTSNRRYVCYVFTVAVVLIVIVLFLFKEKPDVLTPILTGIGGLVSGFFGGWGLGKKQD